MQATVDILLRLLTRPVILFYLFPWLLVILVIGTISQRYIGLYESEQLFFSSYIIWLGPIPTPGMIPILALLGLSLTAKLILKSPWTKRTSGTVITHMGALLLLVGGLLTAITAEEGSMVFAEGETTNIVSDFHARELAILKNDTPILNLPADALTTQTVIDQTALPFRIHILATCRHCEARPRVDANKQFQGLAQKVSLHNAPLNTENEENRFGTTFEINGAGNAHNGTYIALENAPATLITIGKDHYRIIARKSQRLLPFDVRLNAFEKFSYPGTDMAEEYESIVSITDGDIEWQSPIRMNEPLRYKGYTLYQSSFIEADGKQFSVLAVVKNAGRVFPYIASIVMCIGLLIHLIVRRRKQVDV